MSTLAVKTDERVSAVSFDSERLIVDLMDGRTIAVPLAWYPRLLEATPEQRSEWEVAGAGYGIHWPQIDEDLSVEGLLGALLRLVRPEPTFFPTEAEFRRWLEANHETAPELLVGFWKKSSGKPSIDWPQARDQALCFGWIDGHRKSLGDEAYTIRFTPRRKGSIWSKVNVERFEALKARD